MKILCIGQSAYDITLPCSEYPTENKKYKIKEVINSSGGSANNAAYLLGLWKSDVTLISPIGNDNYGKEIIEEQKKIGVNTDYMEVLNIPTTKSYIINNLANGSRTIITNRDPLMKLSLNIDNIPNDFDYILTDGNDYEFTKEIINKNKHAKVIIDAGRLSDTTVNLSHLSDYIVCSNDFAREYTKIDFSYDNIDDIKKCYDLLERDFKGKIVITLESYGSFTKIDNEYYLIPSIKVETVDTTGAGDIYHGAFTYFIANNYSLLDTMKLSNIAGALSVSKIGSKNSIPKLDEVMNHNGL